MGSEYSNCWTPQTPNLDKQIEATLPAEPSLSSKVHIKTEDAPLSGIEGQPSVDHFKKSEISSKSLLTKQRSSFVFGGFQDSLVILKGSKNKRAQTLQHKSLGLKHNHPASAIDRTTTKPLPDALHQDISQNNYSNKKRSKQPQGGFEDYGLVKKQEKQTENEDKMEKVDNVQRKRKLQYSRSAKGFDSIY